MRPCAGHALLTALCACHVLPANVGQLYMLDSAFLFLEKPPMAFMYEDVSKITFDRNQSQQKVARPFFPLASAAGARVRVRMLPRPMRSDRHKMEGEGCRRREAGGGRRLLVRLLIALVWVFASCRV